MRRDRVAAKLEVTPDQLVEKDHRRLIRAGLKSNWVYDIRDILRPSNESRSEGQTMMADAERQGVMSGHRLGRRSLMRGSLLGGAGLAALALVGCGGDDEDETTTSAPTSAGAAEPATGVVKDPNLPYPYQFPEPAGKTPKSGGTLRVGVDWEPGNHDVTKSAAGGTITAPNVAYNRLLGFVNGPRFNPFKLELEPELAASWERTPDGLTYTFKLKPGVKWQNVAPLDGRPFGAADVKFAYERFQTEGVHRQYFSNVKSIEAPDQQTLKITLTKALADFVMPLGGRYLTIFPRELVDDGSIQRTMVGTGPMIMKERLPGQRVVFERNPDYFEGPTRLDGLEFRIILDRDAQLAAFRTEQLDFTYAYSFAANKRDIDALLKTNPNVQLNMSATTFTTPFALNLSSSKYQDVRIRRAIQLSIDPAVVTNFYDGLAKTLALQPWDLIFDKEPTPESGLFGKWWVTTPRSRRSCSWRPVPRNSRCITSTTRIAATSTRSRSTWSTPSAR
jgi:ABC-type transport system substrate-binding protein